MTGLKNIIRSMKGNRSLYSSLLLQTVIIMIYISTISAQLFQQRRNSSVSLENSSPQPNMNKVTTADECKKYLCKYGYLNCDCQGSLSRRRRQSAGVVLTEYGSESESSSSSTTQSTLLHNPSKPACTAQDFTNALKTFQTNYRLVITGICDERTASQMSQRRCGQPDTVIDKLDSDSTGDDSSIRKTRSLSEIISNNIEMEQAIERRKEQRKQYMKEIEQEEGTPRQHDKMPKEREKRSQIYMSSNDYGALLNKERISWRLMSDHIYHIISPHSQRSILRQAFRYWSEVAPLCFFEDTDSQDRVDIEIGFLEGVHLSCYRQFDGYGGEIAHKFYRDVHFDNSEPYTAEVSSSDRISLLLVAVHEIGHVLGLNHSDVADSVMNAIYHRSITGKFELADHDRREARRFYGSCQGRFDTAFDYVRTKPGTKNSRIYNSYFFRNDHYWRYDNGRRRTRLGDPKRITPNWSGVPEYIDTFLHYWEFDPSTLLFYDEYLFFKGDKYFSYDSHLTSVIDTGLIRNKFLPYNWTSAGSIPNNLDATFFDDRPDVKMVYFFKSDKVYSYKYRLNGAHQCCADEVKSIVELFPPYTSSHLYSPSGNSYERDIDVIYLSNKNQAVYFIKGNDIWQNVYFYDHPHRNAMKYIGKWYDTWEFICDGECS